MWQSLFKHFIRSQTGRILDELLHEWINTMCTLQRRKLGYKLRAHSWIGLEGHCTGRQSAPEPNAGSTEKLSFICTAWWWQGMESPESLIYGSIKWGWEVREAVRHKVTLTCRSVGVQVGPWDFLLVCSLLFSAFQALREEVRLRALLCDFHLLKY